MALVDALAEQIVSSDRFLDLPKTTRLFYYHLCATARDGGFVRGVRAQMAVCGVDERDLILLTGGKYLSRTEDGYYRITHWSDNQRKTMSYKIGRLFSIRMGTSAVLAAVGKSYTPTTSNHSPSTLTRDSMFATGSRCAISVTGSYTR